jgi:hypothetical protein
MINAAFGDACKPGGFGRIAVALGARRTQGATLDLAASVLAPRGDLIFIPADVSVRDEASLHDLERAYAGAAPFDAVTVGTNVDGRTAARRLGSTATAFLRYSSVPVFITSAEHAPSAAAGFRAILVALDGLVSQRGTVTAAVALARRCGACIVFARVEDDMSPHAIGTLALIGAREEAAQSGIVSETATIFAFTSAAINAAAQIISADAIVLGITQPDAPHPASVGSMLVRTAHVPVCIVPVAREAMTTQRPASARLVAPYFSAPGDAAVCGTTS